MAEQKWRGWAPLVGDDFADILKPENVETGFYINYVSSV